MKKEDEICIHNKLAIDIEDSIKPLIEKYSSQINPHEFVTELLFYAQHIIKCVAKDNYNVKEIMIDIINEINDGK